jgi:hypothetical protein
MCENITERNWVICTDLIKTQSELPVRTVFRMNEISSSEYIFVYILTHIAEEIANTPNGRIRHKLRFNIRFEYDR